MLQHWQTKAATKTKAKHKQSKTNSKLVTMSHLKDEIDGILIGFVTMAGGASFLDGIEQVMRIILLLISIMSGVILIISNWDKFLKTIRKWSKHQP